MKTFFYMGRNRQNVSGVSWKIWKIERRGRKGLARQKRPAALHGKIDGGEGAWA